MSKRPKRFFEGGDSNAGMKEERDRIDAEAAAEKARTPSSDYGDYIPQSSSATTKAAARPTPKPAPKPAPETSSVRRVNREDVESSISKAAEPSSVRKLSREEGESIRKASAPAKSEPVDETKLPVSDRFRLSRERARSGDSSKPTDTRSVNQRIRAAFGFAKGGKVSSASSRADGIATKGKTRGRVC
jgi:hypothetical protein